MRIIKLGNPHPKAYRQNPRPPDDFTLAQYEKFAVDICGLDISKIPLEGDEVKARDGTVQYVVTKSHRSAFIRDLIEKPVQIKWLGGEVVTTIKVSDASSLSEAVKEISTCWAAAGTGSPSWVSGTHESLVQLVKDQLNVPEVRDYEEK